MIIGKKALAAGGKPGDVPKFEPEGIVVARQHLAYWERELEAMDWHLSRQYSADLFAKREMVRITVAQLGLLVAVLEPTA